MAEDAHSLVVLDGARRALAEARTLEDMKRIHDQAEAISQYAKAQRWGREAQNDAAEIAIEAARRAGDLLAVAQRSNGGRPSKNSSHAGTGFRALLKQTEIARMKAVRWQKSASIPEPDYRQHIAAVRASGKEVTEAGVMRLANDLARDIPCSDAPTPIVPEGVYPTIVADPPWRYSNVATRAAAQDHYPTLTVAEICALKVNERHVSTFAADGAHLYLWTTNAFLRQAFEVIDNWGFEYKATLVWVKPRLGIGNYFRISQEFVLFGVKGGLRVKDSNQRSWFEVGRGRHSRKPDQFFQIVETVSYGPYLELFGRPDMFGARPGWTVWGNEA